MFSSERSSLRKVFFDAWQKHLAGAPQTMLETQLIEIILKHPEYQDLLQHPERYQDKDFSEANPFLHLSLHLALRDQIAMDRPEFVKKVYGELCGKYQDVHVVEHMMMECMEKVLWEAQREGKVVDERVYLGELEKLF